MTTGKIEYSPDYKSQEPKVGDVIGKAKIVYGGRVKRPPFADDRDPQEIERERLECEVVKTAKARREAEKRFDTDATPRMAQDLLAAEVAEDEAIDTLIEFEAKK